MKKSNLFQDTLEREIQDLLAPYPDPMGRTDFRKACRIGTRTSIYLLQSGLVPCENTGKQTRCYKIAKADVAAYLRRRLAEPAYYTPPSGWYKNYPAHKPPAFSLNGALLLTDAVRQRIRRWYERLLARQPDVLNARQIARMTGYGARTVSHWCAEGRLRAFSHQHTYKVPKEWLLEFLTSEDYNSITRKSKAPYAPAEIRTDLFHPERPDRGRRLPGGRPAPLGKCAYRGVSVFPEYGAPCPGQPGAGRLCADPAGLGGVQHLPTY